MAEKAVWLSHEFGVYPRETNWKAIGGVYIFAAINAKKEWAPLYIGRTESLADRLPNHERWQEAARLGARHIHVLVVREESQRRLLEEALVRGYQPPLNDLLR